MAEILCTPETKPAVVVTQFVYGPAGPWALKTTVRIGTVREPVAQDRYGSLLARARVFFERLLAASPFLSQMFRGTKVD